MQELLSANLVGKDLDSSYIQKRQFPFIVSNAVQDMISHKQVRLKFLGETHPFEIIQTLCDEQLANVQIDSQGHDYAF